MKEERGLLSAQQGFEVVYSVARIVSLNLILKQIIGVHYSGFALTRVSS
jgi:hypothetical protein